MGTREPRWFCAQIGAREHYSVPRILHRSGRLAALFTDFWAGPVIRGLAGALNAKTLHSLATRFHPDLAGAPVTSWNAPALAWEARRRHLKSADDIYSEFARIGRDFSLRVCDALGRQGNLGPGSIFFSYDTGALEAMEWCREKRIPCVLNQMDPGRVEAELVQAEEGRWPGWSSAPLRIPEEYFGRREEEWRLADRIVVNSAFCRDALLKQGVPPGKLTIIPLCYEMPGDSLGADDLEVGPRQPLRVLFLGQVLLRKGIQYLMQAAKSLEGEKIQFDVVGPIGIAATALKSAPANLTFHGRVTRKQAADWYRRSDVFILPTLSDGFAITQLEAMSHGLPVVATPNCGAVVNDGEDGFVVPAGDAEAMASVLRRYLADRGLVGRQRRAARAKARQFSLERLGADLMSLESTLAI